jgi:hypothetical protein
MKEAQKKKNFQMAYSTVLVARTARGSVYA